MKFLWGLLAGFALGVAVGLLLAPQSGEATRAQLSEQGIMLRDRTGKLPDELRARATDAIATYWRRRNARKRIGKLHKNGSEPRRPPVVGTVAPP